MILGLNLDQTLSKIERLIQDGKGDSGRLAYIAECLKKNKTLYKSDKNYLENKLNSSSSSFEKSPKVPVSSVLLQRIQNLMNQGIGDHGRLQHIYDMIQNKKSLYHSDRKYLESKLSLESKNELATDKPEIKLKSGQELTSEKYAFDKTQYPQEVTLEIKTDDKKNTKPQEIHPRYFQRIHETMPKGWNSGHGTKTDLKAVHEKIKFEEEKLEKQRQTYDKLDLQRLKLTQLIRNRQEYEQQIHDEKRKLESEIISERKHIANQEKISESILQQKNELKNVQKEREQILKKIKSEKSKVSKELEKQREQLEHAKLEQEQVQKQIEQEKKLLSEMIVDQKLRLEKQAKLAREITDKQADIEITKKEYYEIVSELNREKSEIHKAQKLKKLIKAKENDLIKFKEDRLKLINLIREEKEKISQKQKEEKEKLREQKKLKKQLSKEESVIEKLKEKRAQTNEKIKQRQKKLREKQNKIKKEIKIKNKQLKQFNEKISKKKS